MSRSAQFYGYGNGHDGSPAVSGTINSYASATGSAGGATVTTSLPVSVGDMVLLHQSQGAGAGNWEVCYVIATGSGSFTNYTTLSYNFVSGAQAVLIPQYVGGTLSGSVTCTAWDGSKGGVITLASSGELTISGGLSVNTSGFRGGTGATNQSYQGEGYTGTGSASVSANTNGGGGANKTDGHSGSAGGGGGGNGAVGSSGNAESGVEAGSGGSVAGNASLTSSIFGGGGGGTFVGNENGTIGGGLIFLFVKYLTTSSATITLNGGSTATPAGCGAGGSCLIKCITGVLGTNKITASGGTSSADINYRGGAGGAGRIHCDYVTSVTGTTTPTLDSTQDTSINDDLFVGMV